MDVDMICSSCNDPIHLEKGNWLPCSKCDQSFHLYCLDPLPLEKPKGKWICPAHGKSKSEIISEEENENMDSMILFPYQIIPRMGPPSKRRVKRTPLKSLLPTPLSDLQAELLLSKASNQQRDHPILNSIMKQNKDKLLSDYYGELKNVQKKLIPAALDMVSPDNVNMSASNANATLQMMSSFSPLFIQFLAWQRLMQLQDEVGLFDNAMAPWSEPKCKSKKRSNPSSERERDEPPAKKQKTQTINPTNLNNEAKESSSPPVQKTEKTVKLTPSVVRPQRRKPGYAVTGSSIPISTPEISLQPKQTLQGVPSVDTAALGSEILKRKEVTSKKPITPKKSLSTISMTEDTESINEPPSKRRQQVEVITIDQEDTNTSKDSPAKSNVLPMPPITPQTEIKVTLSAEFLQKKVQKSLGIVKNLPLRIGRCDPRAPTPQKLSLNLQEITSDPSVKRVSHSHVEIISKDNTLYLICLGRNGIFLEDGSLLHKSKSIPIENGMNIQVGPFRVTLHVS